MPLCPTPSPTPTTAWRTATCGFRSGPIRLSTHPPTRPASITPCRERYGFSREQKRLAKLDGHIVNEIDFGYGLLGRIEKGGSFQIRRDQVAEKRWKTTLVDVHISGRIVFFKSINRDQHVVRSAFKPVPSTTSVKDAVAMLNESASAPSPAP